MGFKDFELSGNSVRQRICHRSNKPNREVQNSLYSKEFGGQIVFIDDDAPLTVDDLRNGSLIDQFAKLLDTRMPSSVGTWVDPQRQLRQSQYFSFFLFALFNPVVRTVRGICAASKLIKVERSLNTQSVSPGSFSEAQHFCDPNLLAGIFEDLSRHIPAPTLKDPRQPWERKQARRPTFDSTISLSLLSFWLMRSKLCGAGVTIVAISSVVLLVCFLLSSPVRKHAKSIEEDFRALGETASVQASWFTFKIPLKYYVTLKRTVDGTKRSLKGTYFPKSGDFAAVRKDESGLRMHFELVVTPLMAAIRTGDEERAKKLLQSNDPASLRHIQTAIKMAISNERSEWIGDIINLPDPEKLKRNDNTDVNRFTYPIQHLLMIDHAEGIQGLLDLGARIDSGMKYDSPDPFNGDTKESSGPFLIAAIHLGKSEAARTLIENGADLATRGHDRQGLHYQCWTPLHVAVAAGNADMVKLLLEHGADPTAKEKLPPYETRMPMTSIEMARAMQRDDIVGILDLHAGSTTGANPGR